jgi:hypothetical protein
MGPDGISYLDLADAFARGEWTHSFSTLWSPLYPLLLGTAFRIVRLSPYWEFAEVYVVNFLIYLAALAAFDYLLRQVLAYQHRVVMARSASDRLLSDWALLVLGYALFTFSALQLIHLSSTTPDMLMSVFVYLSAALVLRIAIHPGSRWAFPLLGASLGIGFWAKAPMFPLAFVFLAMAALYAFASIRRRSAALRLLAAAATFAFISGALAVTYLETRGRLTLGNSGKLNYAWLINDLPYAHWQGRPPRFGRPVHPTRQVIEHPPVYEFASPVSGTYPPWLHPGYWYEGIRPRLNLIAHARALLRNARHIIFDVVVGRQSAILTAALALAYLSRRGRRVLAGLAAYKMVLIPAVAAVAMFSLIRVEDRFVGAFVALTWLGLFAALPGPSSADLRRACEAIAVAAAVGLMLPAMTFSVIGLIRHPRPGGAAHPQWRIARDLQRAGVRPGDRIAVVGWSLGAYWARLAGVTIVAEICAERPAPPYLCQGGPDGIREFWAAPPEVKQQVYEAFRKAGAKAVVATSLRGTQLVAADAVPTTGWTALSSAGYYVHMLGGGVADSSRPATAFPRSLAPPAPPR